MTTLALNGLRAKSMRFTIPWTGVWFADVDFDVNADHVVPSGQVPLTVGSSTIAGSVDPSASGRFAEHAKARVVGGMAGWSRLLPARHYHNDAGVLLTAVLETTAAEVRETVVVGSPTRLGVDYDRFAGPAARVLDGLEWYTDFTGKTIVGTRATTPAPSTVQILSWDPEAQRADLASDELVLPGMVLKDDRFGTVTIRDVEQTFGDSGARATAWCGGQNVSRLAQAFGALIRAKSVDAQARQYRYRVVQQGVDRRLTLQSVEKNRGVPDLLAISMWPGMAGLSADVTPGTEVLVTLVAGDPAQPATVSFQHGAAPRVFYIDATSAIVLAGGADFVALAELVRGELQAIRDAFNLHTHPSNGAAPSTPMGAAGSVAAQKVKAA